MMGEFPGGDLIFDQSGNLYGTTQGGGLYDGGTAFKLTYSNGGWLAHVIRTNPALFAHWPLLYAGQPDTRSRMSREVHFRI
jgi:hypothetical protein